MLEVRTLSHIVKFKVYRLNKSRKRNSHLIDTTHWGIKDDLLGGGDILL